MGNKRNLQINVRLSEADREVLHKAAAELWKGLAISDSTIVLSLAKLKAAEVLAESKKTRR